MMIYYATKTLLIALKSILIPDANGSSSEEEAELLFRWINNIIQSSFNRDSIVYRNFKIKIITNVTN